MLLLVALGGALGSVLRYLMVSACGRVLGAGFPYGTLCVNLLGSFGMGLLVGALAKLPDGNEPARLFLAVGVLGGFTTFSAFSLDAVTLYQRGDMTAMMLYISVSVILSILALFAGLAILRVF